MDDIISTNGLRSYTCEINALQFDLVCQIVALHRFQLSSCKAAIGVGEGLYLDLLARIDATNEIAAVGQRVYSQRQCVSARHADDDIAGVSASHTANKLYALWLANTLILWLVIVGRLWRCSIVFLRLGV